MDTAPATPPTPEAALGEIAAIRADRTHVYHDPLHRGHDAATEYMQALYKTAWGTRAIDPGVPPDTSAVPAAAPAPQAEAPVTVVPPPPEGMTWEDEPAVVELFAWAGQNGLTNDQVVRVLAIAAQAATQPEPTGEEMDRALRKLWGPKDVDRKVTDAHELWRRMPQRFRELAEAQRFDRKPRVVQALVDLAAPVVHDPTHEIGIAIIKARYEASLATTAADRAADEAKFTLGGAPNANA